MTKRTEKSGKLIAPSILSADFARLGDEVHAVEKAGADWIHIDVMDGHFVPNITAGPVLVEAVRRSTRLFCDVHLMIEKPELYLKAFADAGADLLTIHLEASENPRHTLDTIRSLGMKAGISIRPATPAKALSALLPHVDLVLVMTVNPGFGGQTLIESCVDKLRELDLERKERELKFLLEADGGISESTAEAVAKAGCDVLVAGSAVFKAKDYKTAIAKIRSKLS